MDIEPMLMSMPEGSILAVIYDLVEGVRTKLRTAQRKDEIEKWKMYVDGSRMQPDHAMHSHERWQQVVGGNDDSGGEEE
jgi:hypothetical protein